MWKLIKCKYDETCEPFYRIHEEHHYQSCTSVPVDCIHCKKPIKITQYPDHERQCLHAPMQCKYKKYGCPEWRQTKMTISTHYTQSKDIHIEVLEIYIKKLKDKLDQSGVIPQE